ncbi:MAG: LapA family protein [Cellulomonas sp.]|uniref:LapA family protein n=1 Tax=Cellulomonas sp. 73-92 TaxID=1895740 RepID=UPI00092BBD6E|nr:LapA family protein [Cellulomonas sp. 73-92]MBN9376526.1 LapA family protein [Cellulomonas sp.]OJV78927.1 MAG: hypothetical protein BGO37_00795 [Cellulomonas sp. 73-92]
MPVRSRPRPPAPPPAAVERRPQLSVSRTRAGSVWTVVGVAVVVLALLVVFLLQNTEPVAVSFLGAHGTAPLALMLLIAGVGVAVIALTIGFLRSESQRRRRDGAHRRVAPTSRRVL